MALEDINLDVEIPGQQQTKIIQIILTKTIPITYVLRYGYGLSASNLLEKYLKEQEINLELISSPTNGHRLIPSGKGEKYILVGTGTCNRTGIEFLFEGYSSEYPEARGINPKHLEICVPKFPERAAITVSP